MQLKQTDTYEKWMNKLEDWHAQARIGARMLRLAEGYPCDSKKLPDDEVYEMRIDYEQGYRIYYTIEEPDIILHLVTEIKEHHKKSEN